MSLRPPLAFNTRPRRLSTPPDAFELHPDVALYGTTLSGGGASRLARTSSQGSLSLVSDVSGAHSLSSVGSGARTPPRSPQPLMFGVVRPASINPDGDDDGLRDEQNLENVTVTISGGDAGGDGGGGGVRESFGGGGDGDGDDIETFGSAGSDAAAASRLGVRRRVMEVATGAAAMVPMLGSPPRSPRPSFSASTSSSRGGPGPGPGPGLGLVVLDESSHDPDPTVVEARPRLVKWVKSDEWISDDAREWTEEQRREMRWLIHESDRHDKPLQPSDLVAMFPSFSARAIERMMTEERATIESHPTPKPLTWLSQYPLEDDGDGGGSGGGGDGAGVGARDDAAA